MSCIIAGHAILKEVSPGGVCPVCHTIPDRIDHKALQEGLRSSLALSELAKIEKSKRSLADFVKLNWEILEPDTPLEWSWHIERTCEHMQSIILKSLGLKASKINTTVVNVPPGSMKSLVFSVFSVAWAWTFAPHWEALFLSGSDSVVVRDARKCRDLMGSPIYRSRYNITWDFLKSQNAVKNFANTSKGVRQGKPAGAKLTGDRYHCFVFDDPNDVKDISDLDLEAVKVTWKAAGNRLKDLRNTSRVVIQQRVHENDLSGYILSGNMKNVDHLCIPMHYTEEVCACGRANCDTSIGKRDPRTVDGQILHPERNTPEVVAQEEERLGSLDSAGQLEQRPAPAGGAMFKKDYWRSYADLPRDTTGRLNVDGALMSCDLQFSKEGSSRTCLMVIAYKGTTRFIHDIIVSKMNIIDTEKAIRLLYKKHYDPYLKKSMISKVLIEKKANGQAVLDRMSGNIPGMIGINPKDSKTSRANAILGIVEAGNVRVRENMPWTDGFIHECASFPRGRYDDQVDSMVQALEHLSVAGFSLSGFKALCDI